jgi:hypothetical protein
MVAEKIKVWPNLVKSFLNGNDGFMARKLTAFAFMILIAYCSGKYLNTDNVIEALIVFCLMVLLLLAVITFEALTMFYLKLKNEKQPSNNTGGDSSTSANSAPVAERETDKRTCEACGNTLP